jgi:archaellum component FlaC
MAEELKILEIARRISRNEPINKILKDLNVSIQDVEEVKEMIDNGTIVFNREGEPRLTIPLTKLKAITTRRFRKRSLSPEELSRITVLETYQDAVAEEARKRTEAYLTAGKDAIEAVQAWGMKHGYTWEDLLQMGIPKLIVEGLEARDELNRIKPEYERLKEENEYLKAKLDPLIRLKDVAVKLPETVLYLAYLQELGANVQPIAKYLDKALTRYVVGPEIGGEKT